MAAPEAQRGQMQTLPFASAGIEAIAAGSIDAVMHQHDSGGRSLAIAQSLARPQRGHLVESLVSFS
jgi:hypothetical protein